MFWKLVTFLVQVVPALLIVWLLGVLGVVLPVWAIMSIAIFIANMIISEILLISIKGLMVEGIITIDGDKFTVDMHKLMNRGKKV